MKQLLLQVFIIGSFVLHGHTQSISDTTKNYQSLQEYLQDGTLSGLSRHFLMATDNAKPFHDYVSTTGTFGLNYLSPVWKGWQWEYSVHMIYDVYSKNITEKDSLTGIGSRYEIANYNFENVNARSVFFRPENLNISYSRANHKITLGRQYLKTPMINLQDGRMRPSMVEGLWLDSRFGSNITINAGYLYRMLPRSIISWRPVEESLGLHSTGIDVSGQPSSYRDQIKSGGIIISHIGYKPKNHISVDVWNFFVENVFQTNLIQTDWKHPLSKRQNSGLILGGQAWFQSALANGGSENTTDAFIKKGSHSFVFSFRTGIDLPRFKISGNVTIFPSKDRFLLPREWGVESFYTFISRERLEGSAGSRSVALKTEWKILPTWNLSFQTALVHMPDVYDFERNKYQVPSYYHIHLSSRYQGNGFLEGLKLFVMYVYKGRLGETYDIGKFIINKVNVSNYNVVCEYSF